MKIRFIFKKLKEREEKHRNCQSFEKIREKIFLIFNELGNYTLQQINRRFSAHPFYGGLSFFFFRDTYHQNYYLWIENKWWNYLGFGLKTFKNLNENYH